jgi:hypothetical protein
MPRKASIAETKQLDAFALRDSPPSASITAPVVGRIVQCGADGAALVDFPGNPFGRPVAARTTAPIELGCVGSEAVLLFENGDPGKPIVVGAIRLPEPRAGASATIDGERVTLSAEREIVLRCGEASITLTSAGKVLIRGTYILTRSSGANRIKGAAVEIN